jgi:hypothetical protein
MKILIPLILLLFICNVDARFSTKDIVRESWKYIQDTKGEFERRAISVENETGEKLVLNYRYFHKMDKKQKRFHEKFIQSRLPIKDTLLHINRFLRELEIIRKVIALAEEKASESWLENNQKKQLPFISAELYGAKIKAKQLGVILDKSYSLKHLLPKLRAQIKIKFPNAYFIEIEGSQIRTYSNVKYDNDGYYVKPEKIDNPFEKKWYRQSIPQSNVYSLSNALEKSSLAAMVALARLKKVDAIYWFTDMSEVRGRSTDKGIATLKKVLNEYKIKLYAHTVGKLPTSKLRKVITAHGEVIKKKVP